MTNLESWIAAYNAMDPRRRAEMLAFAQDTARTYPAVQIKQRPALRLVVDYQERRHAEGAKAVSLGA